MFDTNIITSTEILQSLSHPNKITEIEDHPIMNSDVEDVIFNFVIDHSF